MVFSGRPKHVDPDNTRLLSETLHICPLPILPCDYNGPDSISSHKRDQSRLSLFPSDQPVHNHDASGNVCYPVPPCIRYKLGEVVVNDAYWNIAVCHYRVYC